MRRLEETGVIVGYSAVVDPERLGLHVLAFVRIRYPSGNYQPLHKVLDNTYRPYCYLASSALRASSSRSRASWDRRWCR